MLTITKTLCTILLSLCFINTSQPLAIIWDFENTLVRVDRFKIAKAIGLSDFLLYTILDFKNPFNLIDEVFHLLGHINCNPPKHKLSVTADQKTLPPIFSHWLDGSWQSSQVKQTVSNLITSFSSNNYFDNDRHRRLIEKTMKTMFDPKVLSHSIVPIKSAASLLKSCALKKSANGQPQHEIYLLSNLASDTFDHYIRSPGALPELGHIPPRNMFISGDYGMIKPNEDIFLYFLKKYKLNPKDCIFLDDQKSNVDAAKRLGIRSILVENSNYRQIRKELKTLQVI